MRVNKTFSLQKLFFIKLINIENKNAIHTLKHFERKMLIRTRERGRNYRVVPQIFVDEIKYPDNTRTPSKFHNILLG